MALMDSDQEKAMTVSELSQAKKRERLLAKLLRDYPPVRRMEDVMGPAPDPAEAGEVDAFLAARSQWLQSCDAPDDPL